MSEHSVASIANKYILSQTEKVPSPDRGTALFGAGNEIRTRYLHLGKVALCQMSYARM